MCIRDRYKDEDENIGSALLDRVVHTVGGLAMGTFAGNWDYYGELAYQWGKEGTASRRGYGGTADLGYTFKDCSWKPRVHLAGEYLSGDDPDTGTYEGWDPVLGRWPHWSELFAYRMAFEEGKPGQYTNMQRLAGGVTVHPTERMCVKLDYNYLRADEHNNGSAFPYDSGDTRGHLLTGNLTYQFNKALSGHLWTEYFHPESFYDSDCDDALFLRTQLILKF